MQFAALERLPERSQKRVVAYLRAWFPVREQPCAPHPLLKGPKVGGCTLTGDVKICLVVDVLCSGGAVDFVDLSACMGGEEFAGTHCWLAVLMDGKADLALRC